MMIQLKINLQGRCLPWDKATIQKLSDTLQNTRDIKDGDLIYMDVSSSISKISEFDLECIEGDPKQINLAKCHDINLTKVDDRGFSINMIVPGEEDRMYMYIPWYNVSAIWVKEKEAP